MRNCIDEGTLQAWFDGELDADAAATATAHTNKCAACAQAVRELEAESLIVSQALAAEFAEAVPTERLRHRLDSAVAGLQTVGSRTSAGASWIDGVRSLLQPRVFAYASMAAAILLAAFLAFVYLNNHKVAPTAANQPPREIAPTTPPRLPENVATNIGPKPAPFAPTEGPKKPKNRNAGVVAPKETALTQQERKYENTIANLDATIKSKSPMRPSLQVEYEHNLALVDHAITTTRDAARKNPKDPQAAQFMAAAYQSKIDLMNQIADARIFDR
jgi:hypothetical protein